MSEKVMPGETFRLNVEGEFADLIMTRPAVLNAADCRWMEDLHEALDLIEAAEGLRVVIVSGEGRSFSTGIDLRSLAVGDIKIGWFQSWEAAMHRIEMLRPITIARMHGYAIGGGLQVALACDLRVASEDTQMGLPAVLEALIPGLGTHRLPRYIGLGRARRMILTGELISAREGLEIGLVDWVFPDNEIVQRTKDVAVKLLAGSATAQYFSKLLTNIAFDKDVVRACEDYLDYQARTIASDEHLAAMENYRRLKGLSRH
ncbi:MAG TPA: enoyl-CoA hydratase/isomerase family protein [Blastocatellia bacterium]|nr:enoyl-CoA hydratase/isomerase family protein [Blastocatellia bacterium]